MPQRLTGNERYGGQMALRERFGLRVPRPFAISIVGAGRRQSHMQADHQIERYPASYGKGNDAIAELKFAMKYEPLELGLLKAAFKAIGPDAMCGWVNGEPSGQFARRAWFLYEWLLEQRLELPDAQLGAVVPVLDPSRQIGIIGDPSRRHRVNNNLPGTPQFCPTVRVTEPLRQFQRQDLSGEAKRLINEADPALLIRAVNYIYHKETRSSFALEREDIQGSRQELFINALRSREGLDLMLEAVQTRLRNLIIGDDRYQEQGWRREQNYIGEGLRDNQEKVHYLPPKPEDVSGLMDGLFCLKKMIKNCDEIFYEEEDAVCSVDKIVPGMSSPIFSAIIAFSFVFIHPFLDGNGRMHRLLIHDVLERLGFTPPGIIIPISAVMLRDRAAYDAALERFSKSIMPFIEWSWRDDGEGGFEVVVENDTADLYRYYDATPQVEYLYHCLQEAIRVDLKQELDYVIRFDRGLRALMDRSAMPDKKARLFVKLVIENGRISADKRRSQFAEMGPAEIDALEAAVRDCLDGGPV